MYVLRSYIPLTKNVWCWFSGICEFMSISGWNEMKNHCYLSSVCISHTNHGMSLLSGKSILHLPNHKILLCFKTHNMFFFLDGPRACLRYSPSLKSFLYQLTVNVFSLYHKTKDWYMIIVTKFRLMTETQPSQHSTVFHRLSWQLCFIALLPISSSHGTVPITQLSQAPISMIACTNNSQH